MLMILASARRWATPGQGQLNCDTTMWLGFVLFVCALPDQAVAQLLPHSQSPCGQNYGGCDKENGLCWGTSETTHYCTCKAGFRQDRNSRNHVCTDVDECSEGACSAENSVCKNEVGSYSCRCLCGYMKDYTGEHCLRIKDIKGVCDVPNKCIKAFFDDGSHVMVTDEASSTFASRYANAERCECEDGSAKSEAEKENSRDYGGEGAVCQNIEGHYYCECKRGYVLCGNRCYGNDVEMPTSCTNVEDIKWLNHDESLVTRHNPIWCEFLRKFDSTDSRLLSECGRSIEDMVREEETGSEWGKWTCWSACKPTCWGGLQTRTRKCKNGEIGIDCKGRGSESRECYSGKKCPFRVRKDVNTLTSEEIVDLLQAMEKFKNDESSTGFHNAASAHGWPKQCDGEECCPHGARLKFLSWHRSMMLTIEKGLTRHLRSKTLGLPYWNWLAEDQTPPHLAWIKEINGHPNPFANMTVRTDLKGPMRTVQRDKTIDLVMMRQMRDQWFAATTSLMKPDTIVEFTESLESVHGVPHAALCRTGRRCTISMGSIFYAAFDPIFIFHHTQVDRLWAVLQKKFEDENSVAWTLDTAIETGEKRSDFGRSQMPFGNRSINPYPILKAVNNMRDSYYYKELTGVVYDKLDNYGLPLGEPARPVIFHSLLIAHYVESFHAEYPVYVNYYEVDRSRSCNHLTDNDRIGGGVLLPTGQQFKNGVPNLLPAETKKEPDKDIELKACYTYRPDCTSRCPKVGRDILRRMATPILMFRFDESDPELYKFNWSPPNVMPWWHINFKSRSQFVYFYGRRARHIFKVASYEEWKNCDTSKAIPFSCKAKSPCRLQVGIYLIVDRNSRLCQKGLRMTIVST